MSVVLNMIVRDEAPVIARCLAAVRPYIDRWAICDTGSTDDTRAIIEDSLRDIPGEIIEHPWINFGHNRTQALQEARRVANGDGYILVIDADDTFDAPPDFAWPKMDRDAYHLLHELGTMEWWRPQLFRADQDWLYKGVVHESPELPGGPRRGSGRVEGVTVRCGQDGARRRDKFKYYRDAEQLRQAVEKDPEDLRSLFYLAQSYRDAGQPHIAIDVYRDRLEATRGPGDEEAWYSQWQIGRIQVGLDHLVDGVESLMAAYCMRPGRMEPVIDLARHYRRHEDYARAQLYSVLAINTRPPRQGLFVEPACHGGWRAFEEYGLSQFYLGETDVARRLFEGALSLPGYSEVDRVRLERNLDHAGGRPILAEALDPSIVERQTEYCGSHAELRRWYTEHYSTDVMALSLEAATLILALCDYEEPQNVLDLGSGFSTLALRAPFHALDVTSVDDDAHWLERTRDALQERHLRTTDLYLWDDLQAAPGGYDLVIHDLGSIETRVATMGRVWELVASGGLVFFDDMHIHPIKAAVRDLLAEHDHQAFATAAATRDDFGRHGLLVRKL